MLCAALFFVAGPLILLSGPLADNCLSIEPTVPNSYRSSLTTALEEAVSTLDETKFPNREVATQQLRDAIERVERYIGLGTPNGKAWEKFLKLEMLRAELEKGQRASLTNLADIGTTMRQNYAGLENAPFMNLRSAVDQFVAARKFGKAESANKVLVGRTEEALEALAADEAEASLNAEQLHMISRLTSYYIESGQTEAADVLLQAFAQPNIDVKVHEDFINRLIGRDIAEPRDVNECLLGTRVIGKACLTGKVSVDMSPMIGGAAIKIDFDGCMTSQNKGFNRGVVLRTSSVADVCASKQLWMTMDQISAGPAYADGNLQTKINSIHHKRKIVRKIAQRKAAQTKPQADAIARSRLRSRLTTSYDEQVETQLTSANESLDRFNGPAPIATRFDLPRPRFTLASTSTTFNAEVAAGGLNQIGAPTACPLPEPTTYGVVFKLHQSAITNYLDRFLAGRVLKSDNLDDLAEQIIGEAPEELEREAENEEWMIRMAADRPVDISLDGGRVRLSIKMKEIAGKQGQIKQASSASVTYVPLWGNGTVILQREGEIETNFGRGGFKDSAMRSVLRRKFEEIFKPEIQIDFEKLAKDYPRLSELSVQELQVDQQWLQAVLK